MTFYVYDEQGRVERAVAQSEWTLEDRALMLARAQHYASLCPGCGQPKDEVWHPDNEGWYEVIQTRECHGCTALQRAEDPDAPPRNFHTLANTRNYETHPLPPLTLPGRLTDAELEAEMGGVL